MRIERRVRLAKNQVQYYVESRDVDNEKFGEWKIVKVFYSEEKADNYIRGVKL